MQKYFNTVTNRSGTAQSSAFVTVKTLAGTTPTLYSDNGSTPMASNVIPTDDNGYFEFYAADGRYTLTITGSNFNTITISDILLEDAADGSTPLTEETNARIAADAAAAAALAASTGAALVGFAPSGTIAAGTVQAALEELGSEKAAASDLSAATGAAMVGNAPAGGIAATTVQAAIDELDSEKASLTALAASGGAALVGYLPAGTGAVETTVQSKLRESVSVKDFGAVGDGMTDDGPAIRTALAASANVHFPSGNYRYAGAAAVPASTNMQLTGDGPGSTTITLDTGVQFIEWANGPDKLNIDGISFVGGLGYFKYTNTGVNVSGIKVFSNCVFKSYTRCAVEQNHADSPYWQFQNCVFDAANSTTTIGVALGGNPDLSVFQSCTFLRNRIHIKGLHSLISAKCIDCDFIQFEAGDGTPRAFIWAVPRVGATNSGEGFVVDGCKFGPENQQVTDYRIIYADEGAGTSNGDKFPNLAADSTGYVTGHNFTNLKVGGAAAVPLIYTTAEKVQDISMDNLVVQGTQPSYLIQFRTVTTLSDRNLFRINVGNVIGYFGGDTITIPVSNGTLKKTVADPQGQFEADATNLASCPVTGINRVGYTELVTTRVGSFTLGGGATKIGNLTDATGGTEAADFDMNTTSGLIFPYTAVNPTVGEPAWLQLDAKQGAVSPVTALRVRIRKTSNGVIMWQRLIQVPANWRCFKFPVFFRESVNNWIIEFTSASGSRINLGRVRLYHSREPIVTNYAVFEQLNLSALPTASAGLPAGALWVDAAAGNVVKRV